MNNKKSIILISIIVACLILLGVTIFLFVNDTKEQTTSNIYGTVVDKGNNYIKVKSTDGENYMILADADYELGDFVSVNYKSKSDLNKGNANVDLVLENNEMILVETIITTTKSNTTIQSTTSLPTNKTNTTKKVTTSTTIKTTKATTVSETDVVSFVKEKYETLNTSSDSSFKEKAKNTFITLVDFIFYGGEIKGKTFNELSNSAKAKVIYYTLLLDSKIDNKWPNYKGELQDKYNDIKAKLIAKYMEITTSICENNTDNCNNVKEDFNLLKGSVNLTWSVVSGAFKYAVNKGTDALVNWYEIFSGKR
ncbi:MAG: hypothetical protein J1F35_01290 [Erysipelotrichales bacterium]|nr:hypothetical protein [Erysipelotrichales bacterium]